MNNSIAQFGSLYLPKSAFVIYQQQAGQKNLYIESYDIGADGYPMNAHPLSAAECHRLARALDTSDEMKRSFLKPQGLLPLNVLYINPDHDGYAIWHTPPMRENLLFVESLGIHNGKANLPALLWKASKDTLHIYALHDSPTDENAPLYHAPFFNVYADGKVCMGTVKINIAPDCRLEEFISQWQAYFFNSYFSHLFAAHNPAKGNIVQLWKGLVNSDQKFPVKALIKNGITLKNLLS